jgi:hypothetical protein
VTLPIAAQAKQPGGATEKELDHRYQAA